MTIFETIISNATFGPAIISGLVSIVIAGVTGFYVLFLAKRKLSNFRNELLEELRVKRFANASTIFLDAHKRYKNKLGKIKYEMQNFEGAADGTKVLQHVLDFFGEARDFYAENKSILSNSNIDDKLNQVQIIIDSGVINDRESKERMEKTNVVFEMSISVIGDIYKATIE